MQTNHPNVAVIGAGISGLSAAQKLIENGIPGNCISIIEQKDRVGGILHTTEHQSCLVEHSADMFTTKIPTALNLCDRIGFKDQLISTNQKNRGAFLATRDSVRGIPAGFSLVKSTQPKSVLASPILSNAAKLRFLLEPVFAKNSNALLMAKELSVKDFSTVHWGKEIFDKIVQPLVSGIYTADPSKLSMKAALKEFFEQGIGGQSLLINTPVSIPNSSEPSDHGIQSGLAGASRVSESEQQSKGARYDLFLAPKFGMGSFTLHLKRWLEQKGVQFQLNSETRSVSKNTFTGNWELSIRRNEIETRQNEIETRQNFHSLIIALPAPRSAKLCQTPAPEIAHRLQKIPYASIAIVVATYRSNSFNNLGRDLKFGLVVPHYLGSSLIATSFSSKKFEGRSPEDLILTRSFIGGALNPTAVDLEDRKIFEIAHDQLNRWIRLYQKPIFQQVIRYTNAMPQYHIGHEDLVNQIFQCEKDHQGLFLAGNAYHGVGIPQCIQSGFSAADRLCKNPTAK